MRIVSTLSLAPLIAGLAACGGEVTGSAFPDPAGDSVAPVVAGEHLWTTADGNKMPYTVRGEGEVTVVLVHCWMCDRSFWGEQLPVLEERYRSIAIDLPGHGEATDDRTEWTVAAYAADIADFLEGFDLTNVVLVGHSMGGPVALHAAALAGQRIRGIVAVDTLHNAEFEFSDAEMEHFMSAFEADFEGSCRNFVDHYVPEQGADAVRAHIKNVSCRDERADIGLALMRDFARVDMPRLFSEAGRPIRAINASAGEPTRIDINRKYADFDARLVDDAGHYLQMTRPAVVNPLLIETIDAIAARE